jgi:hypothetical protein
MSEATVTILEILSYSAIGALLWAISPILNNAFAQGPTVVTIEPDTITLLGFDGGQLAKFAALSTGMFFMLKFVTKSYGKGHKKATHTKKSVDN